MKTKLPNKILTVIVRDFSPLVFMQEPVAHRTVKIELTDEQLEQLGLKYLGMNSGHEVWEEVSQCFLEDKD